ncbi:MAG: hypothetical protein AAF553_01515 [Pseudomonadota bacterium]
MTGVNTMFTKYISALISVCVMLMVAALSQTAARAQDWDGGITNPAAATPDSLATRATYVDLVTLAERSELVVRVKIRRQTAVAPERSPGLAPGFVRLYVEAETIALVAGARGVSESVVYLVDVPLTEKGKAPKLKKREMLLLAKASGRGPKGESQLQLANPSAQLAYSPVLESRLRPILTDLVSREAPPVVTGVADALAVAGTLAGESETQIFLATQEGSPVSITVLRRPAQPPAWGVSWGEIIDSAARAPEDETLPWYRLACALPETLPSSANLARDPSARRLAASDYAYVMNALGPCARAITKPPKA